MTSPPFRGPRPSDAELVLFVDGELDAERTAQVFAWLDADAELRSVVSSLRLVGRLLERDALEQADRAGAESIADAVMERIARERASDARHRARRSLGTAIVLAAAAAAFVWVRAGGSPEPPAPTAAIAPPVAPRAAPDDVGAQAGEPTTEIDAVDFGARAGTIFYVPSGVATTAVVWLSDDDGPEPRPDHP